MTSEGVWEIVWSL